MLVVTSAPTGFTDPVSVSHPKCPRKCPSEYIFYVFFHILTFNFKLRLRRVQISQGE